MTGHLIKAPVVLGGKKSGSSGALHWVIMSWFIRAQKPALTGSEE